MHSTEGKLTQAAAMRGRLLKGVGIVKPRKRPAHFVWHRYCKDEADTAIRKHREDLISQKTRLAKGKERMAASGSNAAGPSMSIGPSGAGPSIGSDAGNTVEVSVQEGEADDGVGADSPGEKKTNRNLSDHQTHLIYCFSRLPHDEKLQWEAKSNEDLSEAREEYDRIVNEPPSALPRDRQR